MRFLFRLGGWLCAAAGLAQAGYVSQVSMECSPGVSVSASNQTGSASVSCPGNPNVFAWVQGTGNLLSLEMNQPGYNNRWDSASVVLNDVLTASSTGHSGEDGIIRITGTLHAIVTGDSWAALEYHVQGNLWQGLADIGPGDPDTATFLWNLPIVFGSAKTMEIELLGVIMGQGAVDASHTATITISGFFLSDGVTPVGDATLETASGLRYGLGAGDPAAVPEPGTLAMMAGALAVFGGRRLFRRQRRAQ